MAHPPSWRGRALLFDLFGTVVHFTPRDRTTATPGTPWRPTMEWLRQAVERALPKVLFEDFLSALLQVSEELIRARPPDYLEVPSRERFRRALLRLQVDRERVADIAERLSITHMAHLATLTSVPAAHHALLRHLARHYRLAVVSNFDHGHTAHQILTDHGLAPFFSTVVISAEFGRRKPHPSIFAAALERLGARAADALFIGDSYAEDVVGACNAGIRVVWLNAKGEAPLPGSPLPHHTIRALPELDGLLRH